MSVTRNLAPPGGPRVAGPSLGLALPLGLASGVAYALAFPPLGWSPLVFVALSPWFGVAARLRPGAAAWVGLAWGFGMSAGTAYWLPDLIGSYFDLSTAERWLAAAATSVAIVGVFSTAASAWFSFCVRRGAHPVWAGLLAWFAFELARSHGPIPNPWALSAYALADWERLSQAADLAGPFALGAVIAAFNVSVAGLWLEEHRTAAQRGLVAVSLLLVVLTTYGSWRLSAADQEAPSLSVAIIQTGTAPQELSTLEDSQDNLAHYIRLTREALALRPTDIVVWPEGAIDFRPRGLTQRARRLQGFSREVDAHLLLGGPRRQEGHHYNSFFALASGRVAAFADKMELMPFAEARPLSGWIPLGRTRLSQGSVLGRLPTGSMLDDEQVPVWLGIATCSEAMLPSFVRRVADNEAHALVNPSNDQWFGAESASAQQVAAVRFRAIENRRSVIRAAPTGISALIDPMGRILTAGPFQGEVVVQGEIPLSDESSPARHLGELPRNLGLVALVWVSVRSAMARRQGASPS